MPMFRMRSDLNETIIDFRLGLKHDIVEATQWFKIGDHPINFEGWPGIHPGDWVVTCVHGKTWVLSQSAFKAIYDKINKEM